MTAGLDLDALAQTSPGNLITWMQRERFLGYVDLLIAELVAARVVVAASRKRQEAEDRLIEYQLGADNVPMMSQPDYEQDLADALTSATADEASALAEYDRLIAK